MHVSRLVASFVILCLLLLSLPVGYADGRRGTPTDNGIIVVEVTWDDAFTTPATNVFIEAHSFAANYVSEKSFVLKMVKAGRYEAEVPPGVYDVFVSEASSTPRCRRTSITPGRGLHWKLMLEHDETYLSR